MEYKNFDLEREQIALNLKELKDKSPKGSIDEAIRRFLELINSQPDWITTSTCSGRLVSYLPGETKADGSSRTPQPQSVNGKGGGSWLFVSHSTLQSHQLNNPIETLFGDDYNINLNPNPNLKNWSCDSSQVVHFVYQPPVLHLLARSVAVVVPILTAVIGAGFRNSGMTVGHRGRVMLAIRSSTGGLDVPIAIKNSTTSHHFFNQTSQKKKDNLELLVSIEYLSQLLLEGNQLMKQNGDKLQRLYDALFDSFATSTVKLNKNWESTEERRQRMRSEGLALRAASQSTALDKSDCPIDKEPLNKT